jgi:type IV pilus assembly protein PilA
MKEYLEKRREELKKRGESGFTLMEMLIVVAIIAILIAIAIPVFTSQLENSREATDAANIRSAYAEVAAKALEDAKHDHSTTIDADAKQQTQPGWQNTSISNIAGVSISGINSTTATTITYTSGSGISIDGHKVVERSIS